jgi:hypothetical protein
MQLIQDWNVFIQNHFFIILVGTTSANKLYQETKNFFLYMVALEFFYTFKITDNHLR